MMHFVRGIFIVQIKINFSYRKINAILITIPK
mgnify:CR=1 FL=1